MTDHIRRFYEGEDPGGGGNVPPADPNNPGTPPADPGGQPPDWRANLAEDLRGHKGLEKFTGVEGLARSYLSAQQMIGEDPGKLVKIPETGDTKARHGILQKLGLPADTEGYKLQPPDNAPEGFGPDQQLSKTFVEAAHKAGVLPDQAQAIYQDVVGALGQSHAETKAQEDAKIQEGVETLKKEWGQAFDQNLATANHGISKVGGEELVNVLKEKGLDSHPVMVKAFQAIGQMLSEDGGGGGGAQPGSNFNGGTLAPDAARSRGNEILRQANQSKDPAERRRLADEAQRFFSMVSSEKI